MLVLPLRGFAVHFVVVSCLLFVAPPPSVSAQAAPATEALRVVPTATGGAPATASETSTPATVVRVVPGVFNGDVRSLPLAPQWLPGDPIIERPRRITGEASVPATRANFADQGGMSQALADGTAEVPGDLPPNDVVPRAFSPPDLNLDGSAFTGRYRPTRLAMLAASTTSRW